MCNSKGLSAAIVNPTTGLPMVGGDINGVDTGGNPFGAGPPEISPMTWDEDMFRDLDGSLFSGSGDLFD